MHRIWTPTPWHAEGTSHFHRALSSNYVAFWRSLESLGWKTETSEGWQRKMQNSIQAVLIGFLMVHISGHLGRNESAARSTGKHEGYVLEWLFQTRSKISGTGNTIVWPLLQAKKKNYVKDTPSIVGYNDTIACWPEVSTRSNFRNLQWKYNHPILSWKYHARSPRCFVCINIGSQVLLYFLNHQGLHLRIRDMNKTWDTTRTVQQKHVIFVNW